MGAVPGNNSVLNSTSLSGGNLGNSSRNTSENSHTTGISRRVVVRIAHAKFWRSKLLGSGTRKALLLWGSLNMMVLVEVSMRTPWPLIRFIPKITSIPNPGNTTRSEVYPQLLIEMHTSLTIWLVEILFPAALMQ